MVRLTNRVPVPMIAFYRITPFGYGPGRNEGAGKDLAKRLGMVGCAGSEKKGLFPQEATMIGKTSHAQ
jgi:hypothetical protein